MLQLRIPAPDDRLEWIGGEPVDEASEVAYEAIMVRGFHLERYGPTVDVGLFRRWYVAEAHRLLGRLEGTLIRTSRPPTEE